MIVYPWPGNVRELESVIYEAIVLSDAAEIEAAALPSRLRRGQRDAADGAPAGKTKPSRSALPIPSKPPTRIKPKRYRTEKKGEGEPGGDGSRTAS